MEVEKCVEFRLTDKVGSELIRGRIKKCESYEKLYSVLYAEISSSAMPTHEGSSLTLQAPKSHNEYLDSKRKHA